METDVASTQQVAGVLGTKISSQKSDSSVATSTIKDSSLLCKVERKQIGQVPKTTMAEQSCASIDRYLSEKLFILFFVEDGLLDNHK